MSKKRNLKYQFLHAIDSNFKEKMDKHADKRNGIRNTGKVYSYSDRKNLVDLSANFSNWMKSNYPNVTMIKNINSNHIQEFLNSKSETCSNTTLKIYVSHFQKLEKQINNTYNTKLHFNVTAPIGRNEGQKIRTASMSYADYIKLEGSYSNPYSNGRIAINLAAKAGLRVSEISKLKGSDIDLQKKCLHIIDSKGKRSRDVPIAQKDVSYFSELKEIVGSNRCCPIQSESILKSVNRHMNSCGIKENYQETAIHSIRKMYAQERFDELRAEGNSISKAWSQVSVALGHGADRTSLMKTYISNIH